MSSIHDGNVANVFHIVKSQFEVLDIEKTDTASADTEEACRFR